MTTNNFPPTGGAYESPTIPEDPAEPAISHVTGAHADTYTPTAEDVKGEAASVASDAKSAAKDVVGTVKDEAGTVAHEVKGQVKDLYRQTATELRDQAATQQTRVAEGLRTVGDQLDAMAANAEPGVASDVVGQVSSRVSSVAEWLDARDPGSLLAEVRTFAARKPGTFIAIAALSGVVVGRLTRSLVDDAKDGAADDAEPKHLAGESL